MSWAASFSSLLCTCRPPVLPRASDTSFKVMHVTSRLSHLLSEASMLVPGALHALCAAKRWRSSTCFLGRGSCSSGLRGKVGSGELEQQDSAAPHPLTLLRFLAGGEAALRALVVADRRAARLEVEAEFARLCCRKLLPAVRSRLLGAAHALASQDEHRESPQEHEREQPLPAAALQEALHVLRLAAHLCNDRGAMVSFWPSVQGPQTRLPSHVAAVTPKRPPRSAPAALG